MTVDTPSQTRWVHQHLDDLLADLRQALETLRSLNAQIAEHEGRRGADPLPHNTHAHSAGAAPAQDGTQHRGRDHHGLPAECYKTEAAVT